MAPRDDLFTRDEVLGGLPARRAGALLFLIESRVAHLVDQSRRAADFLAPEELSRERDLAFLEAFSMGREPPVTPTIQDIERYAAQWSVLVPDNPGIRAGVAHLLGRKYTFTRQAVPEIRAALGLDGDAVKRAYRRQYGADLDALFAAQVGLRDWLRWVWAAFSARVDRLPPFWLTFGLTIAFSFSQAFLALPTGVARMGALPGVALVAGIGLVNVLTMACMAEACARSGDFRYGRAFVGRLVIDYLGAEASALFSVMAAIRTFLVMLAGSIGIGLTLATFTGVRPEVWMVALLVVEVYYLSRKSASVTITTMLSLVSLNLLLLLLITTLAVWRIEPANLLRMHVPFVGGAPFDAAPLKLVFGVVVMLYIGHVYIIQCAKIVLPRDPSARSLIRGSVAGTAVLVAIFVFWVLVVNGVVDGETLARETGTALTPLAKRIGPTIRVLGSPLVILLLGMSCLRTSTVLFNLVLERLPARLRFVATLARRDGYLVFQPRGAAASGPQLGVTYLGLAEGHAHLRLDAAWNGAIERADIVVPHTWNASAILERFGSRRAPGTELVLETLEARAEAVSLRVTTGMSAALQGQRSATGLHLADVVCLDDARRGLVNWMTRQREVSLEQVVAYRGGDADQSRAMLDELVAREVVEPVGADAGRRYRVHLATRRARQVPDEIAEASPSSRRASGRRRRVAQVMLRARSIIASEGGRFLISASPVLLVFAISQWLLLTGGASFAAVLGFGGVIVNSVTAGIFPVLLLFASRRKGDYVPGVVYRLLGHPAFMLAIYVLCLTNLLAHGLFIYREFWSRATAFVFALAVVGVTAAMLRRRVFGWRSGIELREDARAGGQSLLAITSGGRPMIADIEVEHAKGEDAHTSATATLPALSMLRHVTLRLPPSRARELKVWAHRITADGASEGVPALVEVQSAGETRRFDLRLGNGQAILPVTGGDCRVQINFELDPAS
jgi:amino acid permease